MPGYTGPNCTIPCPFPAYGDDCQRKCECGSDICDVAIGCIVQPTDIQICIGVNNIDGNLKMDKIMKLY